MRRRNVAIGLVIVAVVAFVFLVPVVPYTVPSGIYYCPFLGCRWPSYGSLGYWAFGVGGMVWVPDTSGPYHYAIVSCRTCYY